jgi:hypothetical protein
MLTTYIRYVVVVVQLVPFIFKTKYCIVTYVCVLENVHIYGIHQRGHF